jgi:putative CocE/NonD family hydrolase
LDHWLNAVPGTDLPPARIVSYECTSDEARGRWIALDQWPPAATECNLHPVEDGSLAESAPAGGATRYAVNPHDGPSTEVMGNTPWEPSQDQGLSEASDRRANGRYQTGRLVFTLSAFKEDTVIAGPVVLQLRASMTAHDTYFVSKLETVLPDGRVLPIEAGYLRARSRTSLVSEEDILVGTPVDYTIPLGDVHWRFSAGEQLRLSLSGGDFPMVLPTAPAGLVTVHHGEGTYVRVPICTTEA